MAGIYMTLRVFWSMGEKGWMVASEFDPTIRIIETVTFTLGLPLFSWFVGTSIRQTVREQKVREMNKNRGQEL